MTTHVRDVDIPAGWWTADPLVIDPTLLTKRLEDGTLVSIGTVLFGDGSHVFFLSYPGGARLARTSEDTGWAIEERYRGDPPAADRAKELNGVWRLVLDLMAKAKAAHQRWEPASP